jgi:hypothetical protein
MANAIATAQMLSHMGDLPRLVDQHNAPFGILFRIRPLGGGVSKGASTPAASTLEVATSGAATPIGVVPGETNLRLRPPRWEGSPYIGIRQLELRQTRWCHVSIFSAQTLFNG